MTDDVESTLAHLEQRLRSLQAELDAEGEEEPPAAPPGPVEDPPPAPVEEVPPAPTEEVPPAPLPPAPTEELPPAPLPPARPAPLAAPLDPLERFGAELRRLAELWEHTVEELRGATTLFSGEVSLEARTDLTGLCALERALTAIPGVLSVTLRAYAAGHAALELVLDREVALVGALRGSLKFSVEDARTGRLAIAVLG